MLFKVGDIVISNDGRSRIGIIDDIAEGHLSPYYVKYYDLDKNGIVYCWEWDHSIHPFYNKKVYDMVVDKYLPVKDGDDKKFRAFLKEVCNDSNPKYFGKKEYQWVYELLEKLMRNDTLCTSDIIQELTHFYNNFEPAPARKKMTIEEIEKELGYEIEVIK